MSHSPDLRELRHKVIFEHMKENEIDYKEEYDKLKRFVKDLYPYMSDYCKEKVDGYFPDLKESEDEKIRKWLINEIKIKHHNLDEDNVDFVDKAIAWLEKQGEQKPTK